MVGLLNSGREHYQEIPLPPICTAGSAHLVGLSGSSVRYQPPRFAALVPALWISIQSG